VAYITNIGWSNESLEPYQLLAEHSRPWTAIDQTAPTNLVTSTTYNGASKPTNVVLGSGDSDAYTYDPNTERMSGYQFNVGTAGKQVTGAVAWNPNQLFRRWTQWTQRDNQPSWDDAQWS
jgi:hypothetical protein